MGLSLEETERIIKTWRNPISLDISVGESENVSFGDFLEDDSEHTPPDSAMQGILKDKINGVLKTLTYREREIIRLRYGFGDWVQLHARRRNGENLQSHAHERIRQIEAKALLKLQHHTRSNHLRGFVENLPPISAAVGTRNEKR